jgi:hypothetical protein
MSARAGRVIRHVAVGAVAGLVVFGASAAAQSLSSGLALGVLVDLRGGARVLSAPLSGWPVGLALAASVVRLVLAREVWWTPVVARLTSGVVVLALAVVGVLAFGPDYLPGIGVSTPPVIELLVSGSQSAAVFGFLGLVVGLTLLDRRRIAAVLEEVEASAADHPS